jgi:hypothetical protein
MASALATTPAAMSSGSETRGQPSTNANSRQMRCLFTHMKERGREGGDAEGNSLE